jgi:hypothetical protein
VSGAFCQTTRRCGQIFLVKMLLVGPPADAHDYFETNIPLCWFPFKNGSLQCDSTS